MRHHSIGAFVLGCLGCIEASAQPAPPMPERVTKEVRETNVRAFDFERAQPFNTLCDGVAQVVYNSCMGDTGEVKGAALEATNSKCAARKRWRELSRRHDDLNRAIESKDPGRIANTAAAVRATIDRSAMYASCWRSMLHFCEAIEDTFRDSMNLLIGGACGRGLNVPIRGEAIGVPAGDPD